MLREGQTKLMENLSGASNPMANMPGFEAMQEHQAAFMKAMTGVWPPSSTPEVEEPADEPEKADDLNDIKAQLAALQSQLERMGK